MKRPGARLAILTTVALGAFCAGVLTSDRLQEHAALMTSGVSLKDRISSLRMRVAAVERENENLRTELFVRQALARLDRGVGEDQADRIVASVLEAQHRYGLPAEVVLAVIGTESGFDPRAVSNAGAVGLMQLMPATAREVARDLNIPWTGAHVLYDPVMNIRLGSAYLYRMFERFDHADSALAAYNAGPARVTDFAQAGVLPKVYPERVRQTLGQTNLP